MPGNPFQALVVEDDDETTVAAPEQAPKVLKETQVTKAPKAKGEKDAKPQAAPQKEIPGGAPKAPRANQPPRQQRNFFKFNLAYFRPQGCSCCCT
jgi:hypothetical protein